MRNLFRSLIVLAALVGALPAQAQSGCSYIATGAVLTAAQWNQCFALKQNTLGYTAVNKAGDTMFGRLTMSASTTSFASMNIPPGVAPTSPNNGDMWTTSAGVFVRVNGVTIGPLASAVTDTLTIGTTSIVSGTTTRILRNNAGVLGEYTITGTGTIVAMAASPALTGTPTAPTASVGTNTTQVATTAFVGASQRLKLTSDTTYNIPADHATPCAAFLYLAQNVDGANNNVTLQMANNTYSLAPCYVGTLVGIREIAIRGNASDPTLVELVSTGVFLFQWQAPQKVVFAFHDMTINYTGTTAASLGIYHSNVVSLNNLEWKCTAGSGAIALQTTSSTTVNYIGDHSVTDTCTNSIFTQVGDNGFLSFEPSLVMTIVGTPTFATFISIYRGGVINAQGATFVNGSAAGGFTYLIGGGGVFDYTGVTGALPGVAVENDGSGVVKQVSGAVLFSSSVVASLPTCNAASKGRRYLATDATVTTFASTVAGGGANNVPVTCNGTNWIIG